MVSHHPQPVREQPRGVSTEDLASLLTLYRVPAPERTRLLAIATRRTRPEWWVDTPAEHDRALRDFFGDAVEVITHAPTVPPPPLCTPAYATALHRTPTPPEPQHTTRSAECKYTAYLHEMTLRHPIGDPTVITDQLEHLLTLARTDNTLIRVIPFHSGTPPLDAITAYRFTTEPAIVHIRSTLMSVLLSRPADVTPHLDALHELHAQALSQSDTRTFLTTLRDQHHNT